MKDAKFSGWLAAHVKSMEENAAELGVSPDEINELKSLRDEYHANLQERVRLRIASKAATEAFRQTKIKINRKIAARRKTYLADSEISETLIKSLGFDIPKTRSERVALFTPEELTVTGFSNGTNVLRWKRAGNHSKTMFIIEALIGDASDFVMVGATMKTKFVHEGQKPGVKIVYRVCAQRSGRKGEYSDTAVIYG